MERASGDREFLKNHLLNRPIAPIFEHCKEKDDLSALRMMCIVDFHTESTSLYSRIRESKNKKLLKQLLQFSHYENFRCYDYRIHSQLNQKALQCKFCELIGCYPHILTHMAINHDTHIGSKICAYCNRCELKAHIDDDSLLDCYKTYLEIHKIEIHQIEINEEPKIVTDFYHMLINLCTKMGICVHRNIGFVGRLKCSMEFLGQNYGSGLSPECQVFQFQKRHSISFLQRTKLDEEFKRIMTILFGYNIKHTLLTPVKSDDVIIINSDSDDNDDVSNSNAKTVFLSESSTKQEIVSINIFI